MVSRAEGWGDEGHCCVELLLLRKAPESYSEEEWGWATNPSAHLSVSEIRVWLLAATGTLTGGSLTTCKVSSTQSPSVAQSKIIKCIFF